IQLQGIKKVFYTDEVETHALADVHLEIKQGDYVSIAGPSGCGKTTLLSLLGLLDTPTEGTYLLEDRPVANLSAAERARIRNRRIGFIFQAFNLIGDLTVYENVALPLTYRGMGGAERKQRSQAALERVGMSHRSKHYPAQLSGGQQQRVAVARAVVGDPAILLADEPTGNLDSTNGEAVMELLRELHRGGAALWAPWCLTPPWRKPNATHSNPLTICGCTTSSPSPRPSKGSEGFASPRRPKQRARKASRQCSRGSRVWTSRTAPSKRRLPAPQPQAPSREHAASWALLFGC